MNITLKTEYALRALQEIINSKDGRPISRKIISERQRISEHFLEKICLDLKKSKIVSSVMGPGGGFVLSKKLNDISLWDVYMSVENNDGWLSRCRDDNLNNCEISEKCQIKGIWSVFNKKIEGLMKSLSLKDINLNEK